MRTRRDVYTYAYNRIFDASDVRRSARRNTSLVPYNGTLASRPIIALINVIKSGQKAFVKNNVAKYDCDFYRFLRNASNIFGYKSSR